MKKVTSKYCTLSKFESVKIYWLSVKFDWFDCEKYFFTDESVKRQITDSISENLTDSDLESIWVISNDIKTYSESQFDNFDTVKFC